MWLVVLMSVAEPFCIVQSDNRDTPITRTSFAAADRLTFAHKIYNCFGKGANKPALLTHACLSCGVAVWLDSDIIVKRAFTPRVVHDLLRHVNEGVLVVGIDYDDTISQVRKNPGFIYTKWFNNGAIVVNCSTTIDILDQWEHYTRAAKFSSDQRALQHMADANSIFHKRIQYDFKVLGVHSAYMKHYPGSYRHLFPKRRMLTDVTMNTLPCPL